MPTVHEYRFTAAELEEIIHASGIEQENLVGPRHSAFRVLEYEGLRIKVRSFRDAATAERPLRLICQRPEWFPQCYGRVDRFSVWEYVEAGITPPGRSLMADVAGFLVALSRTPSAPLPEAEFASWCDDFRRARIFLPRTLDRMRHYFREHKCLMRHWNLEYLDALPKNFVYNQEGCFRCIDAKHIHSGPRGLSLIKLYCHLDLFLPTRDYIELLKRYRNQVRFPEFDDPDYFNSLLFYYSALLLAENTRLLTRRWNLASSRNWQRQETILRVIQASPARRIVESLLWAVPYHAYSTQAFAERAVEVLARRVGRVLKFL